MTGIIRFFNELWRLLTMDWRLNFLFLIIGLASLNLLNNYNSPYAYYPGDGAAVSRTSPLGMPGDGAAVSNGGRMGLPGDGAAVSNGGRMGLPGGNESGVSMISFINWYFVLLSIIGAWITGSVAFRYLTRNSSSNAFLFTMIFAFIGARAILYLGLLIRDLCCYWQLCCC